MLFDEQIARKPNKYPWTQDYINAMWEGHWTSNEFDFKGDLHQFNTELSTEERQIIIRTLSAIGQIEIAVKKFWSRLGDNLPHPAITDLGLVMAGVEVIHNQAYEKLLEVLNLQGIFEANLKVDVIVDRNTYLRKYLDRVYKDDRKQYIYALILFTLFIENVSLFSQFYIILWFNRYKNVLKDTAQQVQYTKNEELVHAQVGVHLINTLRSEYPELFDAELEQRIYSEAMVAFQAECKVLEWIVGEYDSDVMNTTIVQAYIRNRINASLQQIGYEPILPMFEIDMIALESTQWMEEEILGSSMTDFFHKKPVEYSKNNRTYDESDLF